MRAPAKGVTAWAVAHQGRSRSGTIRLWSSVRGGETQRTEARAAGQSARGVLAGAQSRRRGGPRQGAGKGPRGGGCQLDGVVQHVLDGEGGYLRRTGAQARHTSRQGRQAQSQG